MTWVFHGLLEATHQRMQESLEGFRPFGGEFAADHDGVAVEIDAVVRHQQHTRSLTGRRDP